MEHNVPALEWASVIRVIDRLEEDGLITKSDLPCQECSSDVDVFDTHEAMVSSFRQVSVCRTCLTHIALRPPPGD